MSERTSGRIVPLSIAILAGVAWATSAGPASRHVEVTPNEAGRRVDVTIDGRAFTSYVWPERLRKPTLYPIRTAKGTLVTRGWPLDPRAGERTDHPHQVGLWFNHENVNGVDFWNNSEALKPEEAAKKGTIFHRRVVDAKSGDIGEFTAEMDWVVPGGKTILHEKTRFVFRGDAEARSIDRISTLTALDERVVFTDAKDAMLGLRVARQLEQPATQPEVFTDASGKPTTVPVLDNTGVTGSYLTSEGKKGDSAWATRARWTILTGAIGSEPVTIAMLDHPQNPGFPTYWHVRGYGLFAANPLGQKVFSKGTETLNLTIEPRASVTFRYRVLVLEGSATPDRIDREYGAFAREETTSSARH